MFYGAVYKIVVVPVNKIPLVHIADGVKNLFADEHETGWCIVEIPGLAIVLVILFIQTEADSGTFVIDKLTAGYLYLPGTIKHYLRKYDLFFLLNSTGHQIVQQEGLSKFDIII